jgi:hypothetical protein
LNPIPRHPRTTTRNPIVEPGSAPGTVGSTVELQFGHQERWIVCSVTTGATSGMSSLLRVREPRHGRTGP